MASLREGGTPPNRPLPPTPPPSMQTAAEDASASSSRPPLPPRPSSLRRQLSPEPALYDAHRESSESPSTYQLAGDPSGSDGTNSRPAEPQPNNDFFALLDWDAPQAAGGSQVNQPQPPLVSTQESAQPARVSLPPEDDPFGDFVQSDFSGDAAGTDNFKFAGFFSASSPPENAKSSGVYFFNLKLYSYSVFLSKPHCDLN